MSTGEPPARRPRSWLRRWGRRAGILFVVAVVVVSLLYVARETLVHPLLVRAVHAAAPRFSDYDVELGAIHGNWYSGLRLEGVSVKARSSDAPLRGLDAETVAAEFDLLALVRGDLAGLHAVEIAGASGSLALVPGTEPDEESEPSSWPAPPPSLPRIDLDVRAFTVIDGEREIAIEGLKLVGAARGRTSDLHLSLARVELAESDPDDSSVLRRSIEELTIDAQYEAGDVQIDGIGLAGRELVHASRIDLTGMPDERITWDVTLSALGGDLQLEGSLDRGELATRVSGAGQELGLVNEIFAGAALPTLAGSVSIEGDARMSLSDPAAAHADLVLDGAAVRYEGRVFDKVHALVGIAERTAMVETIEVDIGPNHIEARGVRIPLEDPDAILAGISGSASAHCTDLAQLVHGLALPAGEPIPDHDLVLEIDVEAGFAHVRSGRLEVPGGVVDIAAGEFELADSHAGRRVGLDLSTDIADLGVIARVFALGPGNAPTDLAGSLTGRIVLDGRLPRVHGAVDLTGTGIRIAEWELGAVEIDADLDADGVRVGALTARAEGLVLDAQGGWIFESQRFEGTTLSLEVTAPERYTSLLEPGGSVLVKGRIDGPLSAPEGTLEIDSSRLVLAGVALEELRASAVAEGGAIEVTELRARTQYGDVSGALRTRVPADGEPLEIALQALALMREGRTLALQEPVSIVLEEPLVLPVMHLAGSAGELELEASLDAGAIDAHLATSSLDLAILGALLPGQEDEVYTAAFDARLAGARATLKGLTLRAGGDTIVELDIDAPFDTAASEPWAQGPLSVRGRVTLPDGRALTVPGGERPMTLRGTLTAALDVTGSWDALAGGITLDGGTLSVQGGPAALATWLPKPVDLACTVRLEDGLQIERFDLNVPERGVVNCTGHVQLPLSVADLIALTPQELETSTVELDGSIQLADLTWVAELTESLRRLAGETTATVKVSGTLAAPEIDGRVKLTKGLLKLTTTPQINDLEGELRATGTGLVLERLTGTMGTERVQLKGELDWSGEETVFDVALAGENVLLQRTSSLRLRADVDLNLRGPSSALALTGSLKLRNSRIMQSVDLLSWMQRGQSIRAGQRGFVLPSLGPKSMTLDIDVETIDPLRIYSNVARGGLRAALKLRGNGEVPTPQGRLFLDLTRVALPGGPLRLTGGYIEFSERDPFLPTLQIQGETRLYGYDVTVVISGPYDEPRVDLSSSPPLPPDELLILFLTGAPPSSGRNDTRAAAQSLTVYLAKDLASKWASGGNIDTDDDSFFDRFELISGQDVSKSGIATLEARYKTFDGLMRKENDVYVIAERDVYENYNLGLRFVFRFR